MESASNEPFLGHPVPPRNRRRTRALVAAAFATCLVGTALVLVALYHDEQQLTLNSVVYSTSMPSQESYERLFREWATMRHKPYLNDKFEYGKRLAIFIDNLEFSRAHNTGPRDTYELGVTAFSDLTLEEYRALLVPFNREFVANDDPESGEVDYKPDMSEEVSKSVDWRELGAVAPVENQDHCGSCWSFATTGALTGAYAVKTNKLAVFSKMELVDCELKSEGCRGTNNPAFAFQYMSQHGVASEEDYPYIAWGEDWEPPRGRVRDTCRNTKVARTLQKGDVTSYERVKEECELCLKHAVDQQPTAVVINAGTRTFQNYDGKGVVHHNKKEKCDPEQLNHAVLAVGYGEEDGVPFWLIKNSWSRNWGGAGYIKLFRTDDEKNPGECGVAMMAQMINVAKLTTEVKTCGGDSGSFCSSDSDCSGSAKCKPLTITSKRLREVSECVERKAPGCAEVDSAGLHMKPRSRCRVQLMQCTKN